jgi:hypothetical protein
MVHIFHMPIRKAYSARSDYVRKEIVDAPLLFCLSKIMCRGGWNINDDESLVAPQWELNMILVDLE